MNTATQTSPTASSVAFTPATVVPLARKAMLVKLTSTKPTCSRRDKEAESIIQNQLSDTSLVVASRLFKDKNHPVRKLLNQAAEVYSYHTKHTLPWEDRGPRLLPVEKYDDYSTEMRKLINNVESAVAALMPAYPGYVLQDIAERGARATADDYPTAEQFQDRMKFEFQFRPMPDASHYLFDVSDDDKRALNEQLDDAVMAAKQDLNARMRTPLLHLAKKLQVPLGTEGGIFRDSAIDNVVEACELVESLAMGDATVLAVVQEVRKAIKPLALTPNVVRESPVERKAAADRLADVASKMSFLFDN